MRLRNGPALDDAGRAEPSESSPSHGNASSISQSESKQTYPIIMARFDGSNELVDSVGVCPDYDTSRSFATFYILKPAVNNSRVDMSPYGQRVFADAIDAMQAVDPTFDALVKEIDAGKMRMFLSDVVHDKDTDGKGKRVSIPFGKNNCTFFRKVISTGDIIQEFEPALRTSEQQAYERMAGSELRRWATADPFIFKCRRQWSC